MTTVAWTRSRFAPNVTLRKILHQGTPVDFTGLPNNFRFYIPAQYSVENGHGMSTMSTVGAHGISYLWMQCIECWVNNVSLSRLFSRLRFLFCCHFGMILICSCLQRSQLLFSTTSDIKHVATLTAVSLPSKVIASCQIPERTIKARNRFVRLRQNKRTKALKNTMETGETVWYKR